MIKAKKPQMISLSFLEKFYCWNIPNDPPKYTVIGAVRLRNGDCKEDYIHSELFSDPAKAISCKNELQEKYHSVWPEWWVTDGAGNEVI